MIAHFSPSLLWLVIVIAYAGVSLVDGCLVNSDCPTSFCNPGFCAGGECLQTFNLCETFARTPCIPTAQCIAEACEGVPRDCNDNDRCTIDVCDDTITNGNPCVHTAVSCNDNDACTNDSCDPDTGDCIHQPISCSDDDPCTTDSCVDGRCVSARCTDNNLCTDEVCTPQGCNFQPVECIYADECNPKSCDPDTGNCVTTPLNCDDRNACTVDTCNPARGCEYTEIDRLVCEIADPCIVGFCDPSRGCVSELRCDDNDVCTVDSCDPINGACSRTSVVCDDGDNCTADSCNPDSGCAFSPIVCEDGNACTDDVCNPAGGTCSHPPIVCVDTDACTDDLCDSDFGCVFETTDCDDNDACTEESCDSTNGCVYVPIATVVNPGDCPGNTYAFAIDDEDGGGIACIDFGGDKRSTPNTCPDRVAITGSGAPPLLVGSPSVSSVVFTGGQCAFEFDNLGHMTSFELLSSGGYLFELTEECGVFLVVERALRKREEVVVGSNGIGTFQLQGIGQGDPHFVTPWGARFDFDGEASANYALFVAPHVQINMQLAATGPTTRFMTSIAVMFGNETFVFHARVGAFNNAPAVARALEARGGSAVLTDGWLLQMFLCDGIDVEVSVRHLEQTNFLNVKFITPGCMKSVGGALGHTYDCKYEVAPQTFKWAHELEESFRIVELTSTVAPFGREVKPKCHNSSEKLKLSQKN
jgi:hypothetical protein